MTMIESEEQRASAFIWEDGDVILDGQPDQQNLDQEAQIDEGAAARSLGVLRSAGGPGSGNFGHAGRPGEVGGSGEGQETSFPQAPFFPAIQRGLPPDAGYGRTENAAVINGKLIRGQKLSSSEQEMVSEVEYLMSQNKTPENFTVYHQGTIPTEGTVQTSAFLSTSSDVKYTGAFRGQIIAIQVPRGTHFAYSSYHEQERILPRGGTLTRVGSTNEGIPIMRYRESPQMREYLDERKRQSEKELAQMFEGA
jgi:hypothetical protein